MKFFWILIVVVILGVLFFFNIVNVPKNSDQTLVLNNQKGKGDIQKSISENQKIENKDKVAKFFDPLKNAKERITKKPFGIFVTPKTSPVQPERFSGYHTGIDLETTPQEANIAIDVHAFCAGKVIYKNWVNGYGGVLIQKCEIQNQDVTVLYGHLNLASVVSSIGDQLVANDFIGDLGKEYSQQTDGERKHLHFAIHKGGKIVFLGYVQNKNDLDAWIDGAEYLQ